ncbi:MAG: FAD-binding oxidoreductase [Proteobacteria bacterium]|nr:FAD-binding oxidoreductase [Pseudomonadota bacterium]MCP4920521.1 FAD-binding oxidoreductase [Pseudomonadota bacterium]
MRVITDPAVLAGYLSDASNTHGHADGLLRPGDVTEVAEIVRHCQDNGIPLTVTAARTSTTGGPVPEGGWLLSLEKLCAIESIGEKRARAQAGVLLGELQTEIEATGRMFPPDPTSRNECTLGGAIACNASGARSFAYGSIRSWVVEVEAVLPTGEVVTADRSTPIPEGWTSPAWLQPKVKSATGYVPTDNLLDLLIGSEGTLGIVTAATLRLTTLPNEVFSVLAFFPSVEAGLECVESARFDEHARPRCIEWYDCHSLDLVRERVPDIPAGAVAAVWCEQETGDAEADMEVWFERLEASGALVDDTLFADDEPGLERLRAVRHAVPAGVNDIVTGNGMPKVGTDFAVPDEHLAEMMAAYDAVEIRHVLFGHVGDNHLHLNLLPADEAELAEAWAIWRNLYALALSFGGTLSAEHGVGKLKRRYLEQMVGGDTYAAFKLLKSQADPAWILGRGTLLDPDV